MTNSSDPVFCLSNLSIVYIINLIFKHAPIQNVNCMGITYVSEAVRRAGILCALRVSDNLHSAHVLNEIQHAELETT